MFKKMFLVVIGLAFVFSTSSAVYAFENIDPTQAYDATLKDSNTFIVDVRTAAEWTWIGHPSKTKSCPEGVNSYDCGDELGGKIVNISYKIEKKDGMVVNGSFVTDLLEVFGDNPDITLILMCRSGSRSVAAANLLEKNLVPYTLMNMVGGFQGGRADFGYRTKPESGWVNNGLPYKDGSSDAYSD